MFVLEKTMGIADKPKLFIGFWTYFNRSSESVHLVYLCSGLNEITNVVELRLKKSNQMQQYADIYLLLNYSTCFGRPSHPSSGVHKTVVTASGTDHTIWGASFLKRDQIRAGLGPSGPKPAVPNQPYLICTRGCNYSFMYSWWWARWTPETCRVIQQQINICILLHLAGFLQPRITMHGTTNIKKSHGTEFSLSLSAT